MTIFRINGVEVSRDEFVAKPLSKFGNGPMVALDRADFRRERDRKTGKDGRYFGQLAKFPGDPTAVFPSKRAALEEAAKRGMVEDKS